MTCKMPKMDRSHKIYVYRAGEKKKYTSYIKKADEHTLYIYTPFHWQSRNNLTTLRLRAGEKITVHLPTPDQLIRFTSTVLPTADTHSPLIGIAFPEYLDALEMRKYNRLSKMLKTQYALIPGPGEEYTFKKAESVNISAGGMKLLAPEYIEPESQLVLQFILPMENHYSKFRLLSRVKRSDRAPQKDNTDLFHIGVEFVNITKNERDIILNYTTNQKFINNLVSMLTVKATER